MIQQLPQIIAHRGASEFAPENTLVAFEFAKVMGATMFECDVQLSRDLVPVIMHDDTVDRTTHGHGVVYDLSFAELRALQIKNKFNFQHEQAQLAFNIPSLAETLSWCVNAPMALNLELKINQQAPDAPLVEEVLRVIRPLPVALADLMLVSSFSWEHLRTFQEAAPEFALGILVDQDNLEHYGLDNLQATALELNALSINIEAHLLTPELTQQFKEWVPYVLAYTVNDPKHAHDLLNQGVDGVFSNNPLLLQNIA